MPDYDTVVIGSGNGGLTAALSLVKSGLKVLLLERHNIPGGCATSFIRGRFEFEVALHQLSGMGSLERPGPLRSLLGRLGVLDRLTFVEMQNLYRIFLPGSLDITLKADRQEAVRSLKERFPQEKEGIDAFFNLVYDFCMQMIGAVFMRDPEASREKYPLYFGYALKDSQVILDKYLKDPLLQAALTPYWGYLGLPPSMLAFMDFAMVLFAYLEFKPFHLKGGSQALSNALADEFIRLGGEVRYNCGAQRIIVSDKRVKAVVTEDGNEITTGYVVSNAGPITTLVELVGPEHCPPEQLKALKARSVGLSAFTVYMGLDCEPSDLGLTVTTNFVSMDTDNDRTYARQRTLERPETALLTCYDVDDPEFSPDGCCQLALVTLQYGEPWLSVPPAQYFETKCRYAAGMLDLAEKLIPDYRNHIEELEVASPLTHMRYLGHLGGSIYGSEKYVRESPMFISPRSLIGGLYFVGAWNGAGGFQPTLESGSSVARVILKEMNT